MSDGPPHALEVLHTGVHDLPVLNTLIGLRMYSLFRNCFGFWYKKLLSDALDSIHDILLFPRSRW